MVNGICPNCEEELGLDRDPEIGFHITCQACSTELVVVWLNPLELAIIDYEDYDDENDYEFYDDDQLFTTFEKIKKKTGGKNGHQKNNKKHAANWQEED